MRALIDADQVAIASAFTAEEEPVEIKVKEDWLEAIKKDKLIWTNVLGENGDDSKPFLIYGIYGIPDNFLINSEGLIVARNLRGDDLRKKLDELLK